MLQYLSLETEDDIGCIKSPSHRIPYFMAITSKFYESISRHTASILSILTRLSTPAATTMFYSRLRAELTAKPKSWHLRILGIGIIRLRRRITRSLLMHQITLHR